MGQGEQMREKWRSWIVERQWRELLELRQQREMFHELRDALIADSHAQLFLRMFARMYVRDQVITLRSLTDSDRDSMSLGRLLHEALKHPGLLNRQWYVDRFMLANPDLDRAEEIVNAEYDRLLGPGDVADEWKIFADIKRLNADTRQIRDYASRAVAHLSTRPLPTVTFDDLERGVESVIGMFGRWSTIVAGSHYWVDGQLPGDWKRPFRSALFPGAFDHLPPQLRPNAS